MSSSAVHGGSRNWCPRSHECEDGARARCAHPWYHRLHFDLYVSLACIDLPDTILTLRYSDKAGRSVPAPGRGALSIAREVHTKHPLPILDISYRSRQLAFRRKQIAQWLENERQQLQDELEFRKSRGDAVDEEYVATRIADVEKEAARQEKDAIATYGMLEGADPRIAPLRRALAVWGLTADDLGVLMLLRR